MNAGVDSSASLSVAQLAGRFREQAAAASVKETDEKKTTLLPPPVSSQSGDRPKWRGETVSQRLPPPKVKVKALPMIEKLQANLAFAPTALLPGASPKSPGLKAIVSPFSSPPSTPSSPGGRSRAGEAEEVPVSFDQPPEGSHLPSYNKVRTRGSIKRRPPSRRFRKSQSDLGDLGDLGVVKPSQENGAKEESEEVSAAKDKAQGSPTPGDDGVTDGEPTGTKGSGGEPLSRRRSGRAEDREEKASAPPGPLPAGQDNKGKEEEERQPKKAQRDQAAEEGDGSRQASTLEREKPSSSRGDGEAEEARSPSGERERSPRPDGLGDEEGVPEGRPLAGEEEGKSQGNRSGAEEVDGEKEPEGEKEAEAEHGGPEGPGNQGAKPKRNAQSGPDPSDPATGSDCAEGPEEERSDPSHRSTEGDSTVKEAQM
ncbi:capZ-interacting protein [Ornithorhynchus anatinus]|uniref:capZ-interacting protein n=1 Tax=Ornithorhynchus anatinus TaxID=9258 RepID=UPI0019D47FBC|nr:capZ-interacting protein [Ornithorhynchus anatinus]